MWRSIFQKTEDRGRLRRMMAGAALGMAAAGGQAGPTPEFAPDQTLAVLGNPAVPPGEAVSPWLLGVRINGVDQEREVEALRLHQGLALPQEDWAALHLRPVRPVLIDGGLHHVLDDVPGLAWRIDEATQTLVIQAPASAFSGGRLEVDPGPLAAQVQPEGLGGFLNYDLTWQQNQQRGRSGVDRQRGMAGLVELGVFQSGGDGRTTALVRHGPNGLQAVRLDTTWTVDRPDRLASLRLGDAVSQGGTWGRPLRFGGLQWATDFTLQPGFVSFPLPTMRGEAALPSTVDLYINGAQRYRGQVPAGAFDISDVPIVTGQGQVRMVVRDLLGREQVVEQPYYISPAQLRQGLSAYSLELGAVREDYGLRSMRYGRLMLSGTRRDGLSDRFTSELRAELLSSQQTAGVAGLWLLPSVGTLNLAAAASHARTGPGAGWMVLAGFEHQAPGWNGGLRVRRDSAGFVQAGQAATERPRLSVNAVLGMALGPGGVSLNYLHQDSGPLARQRLLSAGFSRMLDGVGHVSIFAVRDLGRSGGSSLSMGLSRALDASTAAYAGVTRLRGPDDAAGLAARQQTVLLQVQRNPPPGPGLGYQLAVERGGYARDSAQVQWQTSSVSLTGALSRLDRMQEVRAGARGGLAWLGRSLFLGRRIEGSFAVVEVGDYPGVRVLRDNQVVARTDERGRALVVGLRGHERNRLSIEPGDLPMDAEVEALDLVLVPMSRGGLNVRFPVRRTRAAIVRLVSPEGREVPPGALLRVEGRERVFPVGFGGQTYVSGLERRTAVHVSWPQGTCTAWLELADDDEEVPDLGTRVCR